MSQKPGRATLPSRVMTCWFHASTSQGAALTARAQRSGGLRSLAKQEVPGGITDAGGAFQPGNDTAGVFFGMVWAVIVVTDAIHVCQCRCWRVVLHRRRGLASVIVAHHERQT